MSFFFNKAVASNSTSNLSVSNSLIFKELGKIDLVSSNLFGSHCSAWFNFAGLTLVSFTLVDFTSARSDFDIKLLLAPLGVFCSTLPTSLTSRFFSLGPPGSLLFTGYSFNYYARSTLLLSYFKPHHFSCQVHFADNLPGLRRILSLSNLAMSGFSNSYLHHYISFVPSLQLHYSFGHNPFVSHTLQSPCLQLDPLASACLLSFSLPEQLTIPSHFPSLSSQDNNSKGGIFFHFSLPKLRLSSFPFALYISRPSSLVPSPPVSHPLVPLDFNRSFYSQNLPSYLGFLGSLIPSSTSDSACPVDEFIGNSVNSIRNINSISSGSDGLSTCDISSFHHFLNLRSRTASFFAFLDSFFLLDSPFLDSLPWDSFSLKQKPSCFPSLPPSLLHTSTSGFSLFDNEQFLANSSFYPFAYQPSCLYEEQFSFQQDLFHPFNHNCSSYEEHFLLNQSHFLLGKEHFLLGKEHFLSNNSIVTSSIAFPSTSFHLLQHCSTFLASSFQASTFKASFNSNFIPYHLLSLNFGNFASSPNFVNFFCFSHYTQLDTYHHLDKIKSCPSANLHFSHFHNSSILSDYFCNLTNLTMQNQVCYNIYFSNLTHLATQNDVIFSNYFYNLSNLAMQNDVISSDYFYNLHNLMLLNTVTFNNYFNNYSCNFVHLLTSNSVTLQYYSNYFGDFVRPNCVILQHYTGHFVNFVRPNSVTLQHYVCNFVDLVHTNNFIFNYYFYNLPYFVMHNDVIFSDYFCNLSFSKLHHNVILNNYFCNLSSLVMYNNVTFYNYFYNLTDLLLQYNLTFCNYFHNLSSLAMYNSVILSNYFSNLSSFTTHNNVTFNHYCRNLRVSSLHNIVFLSIYFCNLSHFVIHNNAISNNYFCNLSFSKLHNTVILSNYCCTLSSFSSHNSVFLSNLFCNFTYFTSLKSCSNEAILHNRSSYLSAFLAKYNVHSLNSPSLKALLHKHTRSFYSSTLTKTSNNLSKKASSLRSHYSIKMSFEAKVPSQFAISLAKNYLNKQFPNAILFAACHQNTNHTHIHVLLFARDIDGKKLHFSNSNYKKLDIGWAKLYAKVFGEHKLEQHIEKKAQSRNWKIDRLNGVERDKPHRISILNRRDSSKSYSDNHQHFSDLVDHQRPLSPLFSDPFHNSVGNNIVKNIDLKLNHTSIFDKNIALEPNHLPLNSNHFAFSVDRNLANNLLSQSHNLTFVDRNFDRNFAFDVKHASNFNNFDPLNFSFSNHKAVFSSSKEPIFWNNMLSISAKQQDFLSKQPDFFGKYFGTQQLFFDKQQDFLTKQPDFFNTFFDHNLTFSHNFLHKQPSFFDNRFSLGNNLPVDSATCSHSNSVLDNKEHLHLLPSINFNLHHNQHFLDHKLPFWHNNPLDFSTCSQHNAVLDNKEHLHLQPYLQPSINLADNFVDKTFAFNSSVIEKTSAFNTSFPDKDFVSNDLIVDKDTVSNRPDFDKVPLVDKDLAHHRSSHNLTHHHDPTLNQPLNPFSYYLYQDLIDSFETDYFRCLADREIGEREIIENEREFDDANIDRDFDEPTR